MNKVKEAIKKLGNWKPRTNREHDLAFYYGGALIDHIKTLENALHLVIARQRSANGCNVEGFVCAECNESNCIIYDGIPELENK